MFIATVPGVPQRHDLHEILHVIAAANAMSNY